MVRSHVHGYRYTRRAGCRPAHFADPGAGGRALLNAAPRTVDAGRVGDRFFVNGVGVGFDAQVATEARTIRHLRGTAVYAWALLRVLRVHRPPLVQVRVDGVEATDQPVTLVTVANGPCCGGGFWLCPGARLDDLGTATRWARTALLLAPEDERSLRKLMCLLERAGDTAGALREFEVFSRGLLEDYGIEPSAATLELVDSLRTRKEGARPPGAVSDDRYAEPGPGHESSGAADGVLDDGSFRSLIESLADMVVLIGATGTIQYISPAVERVTGLPPAEMMGRSIWDFIHPDDLDFIESRAASRLRGEGNPATYTEIRMRHKDGFWRLLQLRGRRYTSKSSAPNGPGRRPRRHRAAGGRAGAAGLRLGPGYVDARVPCYARRLRSS